MATKEVGCIVNGEINLSNPGAQTPFLMAVQACSWRKAENGSIFSSLSHICTHPDIRKNPDAPTAFPWCEPSNLMGVRESNIKLE